MMQTVSFAGRRKLFLLILIAAGFVACSPGRRIGKAQQALLKDTALAGAHAGISIYDPATNRYLYNYQGDHYFVPASNTKLFTCYAAMKYLGDSLVGARYQQFGRILFLKPTGDPTFLHPDYDYQPLLRLLHGNFDSIYFSTSSNIKKYGPGWGWDDFDQDYMPERSQLPVYGNVFWVNNRPSFFINARRDTLIDSVIFAGFEGIFVKPSFLARTLQTGIYKHESILRNNHFLVKRKVNTNDYYLDGSNTTFQNQAVPFVTDNSFTALGIIQSIIHKKVGRGISVINGNLTTIHSQPTDSLLKPMMHRSDNFFAEQSLLMVSNEKLGFMSDEAIIDTLLKNDLKDLPQKPIWVDGSGLSRYNQFTPQDIVTVLLKIKNEFGLERIRNILPKGNTGTLTNYYEKLGPAIFAKTGSLSGQVALSGYLTCKSGKLLLFSILVNNHNSSGRAVRRAVEKFVLQVWEKN